MSGTLNTIYNNVSFALQLHTKALTSLQEQASTGSRINRASDDPSAAYRVLGLNTQQTSMENYIDNLSEVISTLELSSMVIQNMVSTFAEVKSLLTQVSSGVYGQESRERTADSINDTLEQMVLLANTDRNGQYLFGGSDTDSTPYVVQRTDGEITSVTYRGSSDRRNFEVAPGVQASAFYVGDDIFYSDNRSDPVFAGETGATAGTGTSNVTGDVWLTVTGSTGNYDLSIDDGLTTFNTNGTDTNLAVTDSRTGKVLYVDTTGINSTGVELVRVPGTYDLFSMLISIRDILKNDRNFSEAKVQQLLDGCFESLDEVYNLLVQNTVSMGAKIGFLDSIKDSLTDMKYDAEDETTRLQEADIAQIAIDLSRHEVLYQMSLAVAAKIMSLSLLDFIR
jgi:flagellar hook-associated protein 3 FlgL